VAAATQKPVMGRSDLWLCQPPTGTRLESAGTSRRAARDDPATDEGRTCGAIPPILYFGVREVVSP
jgi:hypothetical protein